MSLCHRTAASALATLALALATPAAQAAVFVNEIHYDDATAAGDVGERIEVAATNGENLSGYRIVLYNGNTPGAATTYDDDVLPAPVQTTCGGAAAFSTVAYATNGLQNGPSDGIALVDPNGQVVQFISYEGAITASNGPAMGMTSTNLPVAESNATAAGTSLQLTGEGTAASDFTWAESSAQTFGTCNQGQVVGGGGNPGVAPTIVSTAPRRGQHGFPPASDLAVVFSEPVTLQPGAFALACKGAPPITLQHPSSGTTITFDTGTSLPSGARCGFAMNASRVTDSEGLSPARDLVMVFHVATATTGDDYYARVNTSSPSQLRCSLHETIRGHTVYPYSGSGTSTWTILEIADEDPTNPGRILDVYKNHSYAKGSDRAGTGSGSTYNREHTWPNSLGFGSPTGNLGLPYAPYTDTHMLYLSDTAYNADRGNKPYANCATGCGERTTDAYNGNGGGSGVYPGNSNWVQGPEGNNGSFETWGHRKGDMARAVMYMAIRYEGGNHPNGQGEPDLELTDNRAQIVATSASPAYMGLLSTLLAWHQADPPDAAERARNEVVFSFQGNRNPFIDHPEWGTAALFGSSQPTSCQLAEPKAATLPARRK